MKRLYVIGNGFDIYHGINSRYSDFGQFLENRDSSLYNLVEEYLNTGRLWNDFEAALADFDTDKVLDYASIF